MRYLYSVFKDEKDHALEKLGEGGWKGGNVLFQVEQGMCWKAGCDGAESCLPGGQRLMSRPQTVMSILGSFVPSLVPRTPQILNKYFLNQ